MAVPFSNTKLRVPRGFQNLLEGLAREVLRSQPNDIYSFGALYFENLLNVREESGTDPAQHGAQMEDRFYNNKSFQQPDVDPSDPEQQAAALKIQTKYRQHNAKQQVEQVRQEKAATKIQSGFRGHRDREKVKELKASSESESIKEEAKPETQEEEVDIDLNDPEVGAAATKIQAGWRGSQARKEVKAKKEQLDPEEEKPAEAEQEAVKEETSKEEEVDIDLNDPEVGAAATKIQAGWRGAQGRKEAKEKAASKADEQSAAVEENQPETQDKQPETREEQPETQEEQKQETAAVEDKKPEEEEVDIDLNDPEVEQAAIKIQAGMRGMQARKKVQEKKEATSETKSDEPAATEEAKPEEAKPEEPKAEEPKAEETKEEEVDIDLNDPEVADAAAKIQAGFRGHIVRKELKEKKEAQTADATQDKPEESAE
ncbi:unnamed protein product [Owenia fusiformis]|uniref:Uncharacterized protein n=1 Tax=Owenia fusiformis TaxID=6347 RepID=A0A8J1TUU1_OWEFU|nr:unnamed protein product [Owenia fusiformis]